MGSYTLHVDKGDTYKKDLKTIRDALSNEFTDGQNQKTRKARGKTKTGLHDVTITGPKVSLKVWIREGDFYVVGYEAGGKLWCFDKDEAKTLAKLNPENIADKKFDANYPEKAFTATFSKPAQIEDYLTKIKTWGEGDKKTRGAFDEPSLFLVPFLVSEALRFVAVQEGMAGGMNFKTAKTVDYKDLVKNWSNISSGDTKKQIKRPDGKTVAAKECQDLLACYHAGD